MNIFNIFKRKKKKSPSIEVKSDTTKPRSRLGEKAQYRQFNPIYMGFNPNHTPSPIIRTPIKTSKDDPTNDLLNPFNPLSPICPMNPLNVPITTERIKNLHTYNSVDTSSPHSSHTSHHDHSSSSYSSESSSYDSGSNYDAGSNFDCSNW